MEKISNATLRTAFSKFFAFMILAFCCTGCDQSEDESIGKGCLERKMHWDKDHKSLQLQGMKCDGMREGFWISYESDGSLRGVMEFRRGLPYGSARSFGYQGRLEWLLTFGPMGKLDGPFEDWFGGKVAFPRVRGQFAFGKPIGLWEWLDTHNGNVVGYRSYSLEGIMVDSLDTSKFLNNESYDPLSIVDVPLKHFELVFQDYPWRQ